MLELQKCGLLKGNWTEISQTSLFTLEKYKWWFWASVVLTLLCVLGGLSTVKDMLESSLEEERRSSYSSPQPEKVLLLWSLKIRDEALAIFYFDSFLFNSLSFLFPALFHSFLFCQTFFFSSDCSRRNTMNHWYWMHFPAPGNPISCFCQLIGVYV